MLIYFLLPSLIIFTKGSNNSDQPCKYLDVSIANILMSLFLIGRYLFTFFFLLYKIHHASLYETV